MHETILSNRFLIVRAKKLRCGREESRRFYREHAGRRAGAGGRAQRADKLGRRTGPGPAELSRATRAVFLPQGGSSTSGWWSSWPGTCCARSRAARGAGRELSLLCRWTRVLTEQCFCIGRGPPRRGMRLIRSWCLWCTKVEGSGLVGGEVSGTNSAVTTAVLGGGGIPQRLWVPSPRRRSFVQMLCF